MNISRKEVHDIKNQLSISIGLIELVIKKLKKNEALDLPNLIERLEKCATATHSVNQFFEDKKKTDPDYLEEQ